MKIRPVGARLFHAERGVERRSDMTKLMAAFCNLPKAPKSFNY